HVMMAYTRAVLPTLQGSSRVAALQSAFDAAIAKVNTAFAASLITARMKLVRIIETNYARDGVASGRVPNLQDDALTDLQGGADGVFDGSMDELHAARDQAGADVVVLALNREDSEGIGLSYVLENPGDNYNALFSFSIVEYASIAGTSVVPHELGHVLGCVHDRENSTGPGAYSYSYGYRFLGADNRQYRDIMAYRPGTELNYFSNPVVVVPLPVNRPIGIAAGQPGEADNARTIEQGAFEVATFRLQTVAAANAGTLINVATRAFVGAGEQVLIGGFIIEGSQPKKILVRAAGPSLANFGVGNALANPALQLFSSGALMGENDDWSAQPAATEVALAAAQVGAFAFASGSADAALLVTLEPGAYSAVVRGAGGATGGGMVEVYEADRNATKIVNLSTRGYADVRGKEMFGGFVVQGAAGSTKRILIRVLGPTLGRPPFNIGSAMADPFMEVRNEPGELLIQNDDWSSGSEGGTGVENDFKPLVELHGEKQIAATGFAPANRREPCVMVDLPPGNYSVIVKPFELIDPDPEISQPARPGVAIVEVYEINR
ncbi:MAG: M12 family metallo-peptidase, partial [Opitutaceae bacterium]